MKVTEERKIELSNS
jgi:hypothetical protein